jgi:translation initiation factor IF-2
MRSPSGFAPATPEGEKKSMFVPISKVREAEQQAAATPPPSVTPAPAAPEGAEVIEEDGKKIIHLKAPIIVRELAAAMGVKPFQVIGDLMSMNIFVNLTQAVEAGHRIEDLREARLCLREGEAREGRRRAQG